MENLSTEIKKELKKESLRYVSDSKPGFWRQKIGKKFTYYDEEGKKITDKNILERIDSLAIPPAWKNVWICKFSNGHLQATGIDEKNRKQYLYHPDWIKITQENKFSKMTDFGLSLPKIRRIIGGFMKADSLDKKRIIATIVWLLEHTFIRIGNEEYAQTNNSFGLTTLRNKHVKKHGSDIILSFKGKSGVHNTLIVSNPMVVKTIKRCVELPGYELFQYVDDVGDRHVVDSEDVNMFLKEVAGDDFTAKDFRTWGATNLSADIFYKIGHANDPKILKKNITHTVRTVANHLNNTVSVCRNYYIHPTVIKTYERNILIPYFGHHKGKKSKISGLTWSEQALISLLKKYPL